MISADIMKCATMLHDSHGKCMYKLTRSTALHIPLPDELSFGLIGSEASPVVVLLLVEKPLKIASISRPLQRNSGSEQNGLHHFRNGCTAFVLASRCEQKSCAESQNGQDGI
jgi:hypothetical protein